MDESAGQEAQDATSRGTSRGMIIGPGQGRTIQGTGDITLIATAEETGGSIGIFEGTSPPGDGPPRHVHYGSDELFYILEEGFLFLVGQSQESVSAGTYVFVPRGTGPRLQGGGDRAGKVAHGFHPRGPGAARRGVRQVVHRGRRGESERGAAE
jgi:quercetin dioxygenase-like cupin family protein